MTPAIYNFTRALLAPCEHFATLDDIRPDSDPAGLPRTTRTARFAEVQIEWQGAQWLLSMPLTSAAIPETERMAARLKTLRSEWLAEYRLLRGELHYTDSAGERHTCDLVLQRLPAGTGFSEALTSETPERLTAAIDALEEEFRRLGISHRNLKPENLRWSGGRLIPIRYYYACPGAGKDTQAFETLRKEVRTGCSPLRNGVMHDVQAIYTAGDRFPGHSWVGNVFEQMVCVEDGECYGYVDTANRTVIPAQYVWADDFHEGRAAVETRTGMGLIDKTGRYVIEPRFEIVEYDPETGRSQVRSGGRWADFDYEGRQLEDFGQTTMK